MVVLLQSPSAIAPAHGDWMEERHKHPEKLLQVEVSLHSLQLELYAEAVVGKLLVRTTIQ